MPTNYVCDCCQFQTKHKNLYATHCTTKKHMNNAAVINHDDSLQNAKRILPLPMTVMSPAMPFIVPLDSAVQYRLEQQNIRLCQQDLRISQLEARLFDAIQLWVAKGT